MSAQKHYCSMGIQDAHWREDVLTLMSAQRHHCSMGVQDARTMQDMSTLMSAQDTIVARASRTPVQCNAYQYAVTAWGPRQFPRHNDPSPFSSLFLFEFPTTPQCQTRP